MLDAVALDCYDSAHPCPVLRSVGGARAEPPRDVTRRVTDRPIDVLLDAVIEDGTDRLVFDPVRRMGDQVALAAVLAVVEGGDLTVEAFSALLDLGEPILGSDQFNIRAASFSERALPTLGCHHRFGCILQLELEISTGFGESVEVNGGSAVPCRG